MYIRLDSVEKVKEFVRHVENCNAEVDLISGKQEVDGKSLLGIFSLDLRRPLQVRILTNSQPEKLQELLCRYAA
jgi:phosphotransferase system HPr-like phosphotransfer protein